MRWAILAVLAACGGDPESVEYSTCEEAFAAEEAVMVDLCGHNADPYTFPSSPNRVRSTCASWDISEPVGATICVNDGVEATDTDLFNALKTLCDSNAIAVCQAEIDAASQ